MCTWKKIEHGSKLALIFFIKHCQRIYKSFIDPFKRPEKL